MSKHEFIYDGGVEMDSDGDYKWWNEDEYIFNGDTTCHILGTERDFYIKSKPKIKKLKNKQEEQILSLYKNFKKVDTREQSNLIIVYEKDLKKFITFFNDYNNKEIKTVIESGWYKILYLKNN